jgi:mono/diheme cytochrome c family protein
MIRFGTWLIAALSMAAGAAAADTPLERGKYLVEGILTCGNCHTPRGPGGVLDTARLHAGGPQRWDTSEYTVKGANITPDRETGIGGWSANDVRRGVRDGVRPNGQQLSPQMPYGYYKIFTPADLEAVVVYVRSLPPVSSKVAASVYKVAKMHVEIPAGADQPMPESAMKDPAKRGFYLVTLGHCMECHSPRMDGRSDLKNALGKGGEKFEGPWGVSVSRNITSHPVSGLGGWSDAEIKRAITQGVGKDGRKLLPPMGFAWYARMTDQDLDAIVAYLQTVPPLE